MPEDDSAEAILVTVDPDSTRSALPDSGLARFGIHIPVADSPIARPALDTVASWEFSDSALSGDPDADTRRVRISLRSEWGADMGRTPVSRQARA